MAIEPPTQPVLYNNMLLLLHEGQRLTHRIKREVDEHIGEYFQGDPEYARKVQLSFNHDHLTQTQSAKWMKQVKDNVAKKYPKLFSKLAFDFRFPMITREGITASCFLDISASQQIARCGKCKKEYIETVLHRCNVEKRRAQSEP
jgi:hypothetical protein